VRVEAAARARAQRLLVLQLLLLVIQWPLNWQSPPAPRQNLPLWPTG
jgi:hypothetical protein